MTEYFIHVLQKPQNRSQRTVLHWNFTYEDLLTQCARITLLVVVLLFMAVSVAHFSSVGLVVAYIEFHPQMQQSQNENLSSLRDAFVYPVKCASELYSIDIKSDQILTNEAVKEFVESTVDVLENFSNILF